MDCQVVSTKALFDLKFVEYILAFFDFFLDFFPDFFLDFLLLLFAAPFAAAGVFLEYDVDVVNLNHLVLHLVLYSSTVL